MQMKCLQSPAKCTAGICAELDSLLAENLSTVCSQVFQGQQASNLTFHSSILTENPGVLTSSHQSICTESSSTYPQHHFP